MNISLPVPRSNVAAPNLAGSSGLLASISVGTAATFVVLLAALHGLEPEIEESWRFISEYQLGRWGWLMSVAFLCLAVSGAALVVLLRSQVRTVGGRIGLVLLGVGTLGFLLGGVFRSDSSTATSGTPAGAIHNLGAVLGGFIPLAAYLLAWSLARTVAWRPHRAALWWVTVPAIIANVASIWQQVVLAGGGMRPGPTVAIGWPNRFLVVAMAAWLLSMALLIRTVAKQDPTSSQRAG